MASRSLTSRRARRRREGNVAILTVLMLTAMMGFVALSFDIGNVYRVRTESQTAVDSAALAGAARLNGTDSGVDGAKTQAVTFGNLHYSYGGQVVLTNTDVEAGNWDFDKKSFNTDVDVSAKNAIKVTYEVPSVSLPFAAVIGKSSMPVKVSAIAVGGGPYDNSCGFPMVLPDCAVQNAVETQTCSMCLKMADANEDTAAWTTFETSNGTKQIVDVILDACFVNNKPAVDPVTGECTGGCSSKPTIQDPAIKVNGGNFFNAKGCDQIQALLLRDGTPKPFSIKAPVVHVDAKGGSCAAGNLNGQMNIIGTTILDIYAAGCGYPQGNGNGSTGNGSTGNGNGNGNGNGKGGKGGGGGGTGGGGGGSGGSGNGTTVSADMPDRPANCTAPAGNFLLGRLHQDPDTKKCGGSPTTDHAGGGFYGVSGEPRLVQ